MGKAASGASLRYLIHDGEYPVDAFLRSVFFFGQRHRLTLGAKKGTLLALVTKTTAMTELYSVAVKNNRGDRALQCSSENQRQWQNFTVYKNKQQ